MLQKCVVTSSSVRASARSCAVGFFRSIRFHRRLAGRGRSGSSHERRWRPERTGRGLGKNCPVAGKSVDTSWVPRCSSRKALRPAAGIEPDAWMALLPSRDRRWAGPGKRPSRLGRAVAASQASCGGRGKSSSWASSLAGLAAQGPAQRSSLWKSKHRKQVVIRGESFISGA